MAAAGRSCTPTTLGTTTDDPRSGPLSGDVHPAAVSPRAEAMAMVVAVEVFEAHRLTVVMPFRRSVRGFGSGPRADLSTAWAGLSRRS